jgi:hypothetical protein
MSNREKRREALEAERIRDELAAREAADTARVTVRLRPRERVMVRLLDETPRTIQPMETNDE